MILETQPCLLPGETHTMRFEIPAPGEPGAFTEYEIKDVFSYYCEGLNRGIDESLLTGVSIEITKEPDSDGANPLGFNIVVTNDSSSNIGWTGELVVRDVEGNVVHRGYHNTWLFDPQSGVGSGCIGPNGRWNLEVRPTYDTFGQDIPLFYDGVVFAESEFKTVELYECD